MNRREFIRNLALLAVGAAALPEQLDAFERYYTINALPGEDLAAVDEIWITGMARSSTQCGIELLCDGKSMLPGLGVNLFGGIIRWVAAPDQKIVAPKNKIAWKLESDVDISNVYRGHISYIGQDGIRVNQRLLGMGGKL